MYATVWVFLGEDSVHSSETVGISNLKVHRNCYVIDNKTQGNNCPFCPGCQATSSLCRRTLQWTLRFPARRVPCAAGPPGCRKASSPPYGLHWPVPTPEVVRQKHERRTSVQRNGFMDPMQRFRRDRLTIFESHFARSQFKK